jgi:hypothetical protein
VKADQETPKINFAPDAVLSAAWSERVLAGDKRQRIALRRLAFHLGAMGVAPDMIVDADIEHQRQRLQAQYEALPPRPGRKRRKPPDVQARWDVNAFIRALAAVCKKKGCAPPNLTPLAGPRDLRADERTDFEDKFAAELEAYFKQRKPSKPGPLSQQTRDAETNAFCNCYRILKANGVEARSLKEFLTWENSSLVKDACEARGGEMAVWLQIVDALCAYANAYDDVEAHDSLASRRRGYTKKDGIGRRTLARLAIFNDENALPQLIARFAAQIPSRRVISVQRAAELYRTQSAVYALCAILGPNAFDTISKASFNGPTRTVGEESRPTLAFGEDRESLEAEWPIELVEVVDDLYFAAVARGFAPQGLLTTPKGLKRSRANAVRSIENLLALMKLEFTLLELRDIGVAQMIRNGKSDLQIAAAARLTEPYVEKRYKALRDNIEEIKCH